MLFKIIFIVTICALLFYYFIFDFDFSDISSYFVLLWTTVFLSVLLPSVLSKTEYIKEEKSINKKSKNALPGDFRFEKYIEEKHEE